MSLKQKALSGIKWTTFSAIIASILQIIQLAVLARFLEPSDFGLMALVMIVIGFSQAFLDMGISNAIIHKQEITHEQLSTLYWVNVMSGFILFGIVSVLAPLISDFYNEPELTKLTIIIGFTFLIQPFGQQFMILWQKELRFKTISKIDVVSKFVTLMVSVLMAIKGFGVFSLVYGTLSGIVCQTVLFVWIGTKEHKPSFVFKLSEVNEFLSFGAYQMGEKTLNYFNSQIDTILIGKLLGMESLGVYNVAKQLIVKPGQLINPIITKVTFPAMSKLQDDTERLKNVYLKTINYLSSINFPIYVLMVVLAPEIVHLLFGENWMKVVPIVQVLSIYAAIRSTGNPIGALLLAKGKANWGFWWNLGLFFYIPAGIYVFSFWGVLGISWGLTILISGLVIPSWFLLVRPLCGAEFWEFHWNIIKPAFFSVCTGMVIYALSHELSSIYMKLFVLSTIAFIMLIIMNWFWNRDFFKRILNLRYKN